MKITRRFDLDLVPENLELAADAQSPAPAPVVPAGFAVVAFFNPWALAAAMFARAAALAAARTSEPRPEIVTPARGLPALYGLN